MKFTQNWIDNKDIKPHWERILTPLNNKPLRMLEIGCFEGRSTVWFLRNVLKHPNSQIVCIDTFLGDEQQYDMGVETNGIKSRFLQNIKQWEYKVTIREGRSQSVTREINELFDIIYIDGSHYQTDVLEDIVLTFPLLLTGGVLICDDYEMQYTDKYSKHYAPRVAIDAFINVYGDHIKTLHKGWQYICQKV